MMAGVIAAAYGLFLALYSPDQAMAFHGLLLAGSAGVAIVVILKTGFGQSERKSTTDYVDGPVKVATIAALIWGIAGFLVGDIIAWQLAFPALNLDLPWTSFGRLRPCIHRPSSLRSAVTCCSPRRCMLSSARAMHLWRAAGRRGSWCGVISFSSPLAGTGYLFGITQSKEYAEPEWYVDLWLTIVWVVYLLVFLGTLAKRREPHIYVANWFFLAFIVTVAMLHVVNNAAIPVGLANPKSYIVYAGVQDAMTQWWYGHNAVGFFLTAGFLGIMYYFIPKRVERPVYSYRLSIVHFWSLIFLYIWAGPHHLHYTALPDWAQTLGVTFSIMLWMPSWGGMINGLMTLSGAWDKLRTDPVVRFLVVSVAFYGMSTFEGPLMAIKAVNSLSHYTDWTIGHVHSGALGWVAMVSFGAIYCLVPWLWKREGLYSMRLVEWHFWISTIGILLYITAMWVSGITQGLMWRAYDNLGFLQYSFIETVEAMKPYYVIRAFGGFLFLLGSLIMAYNIWRTIRGDTITDLADQPRIAAAPGLRAVPAE
ncbi:MAG: cytochrome-c oxidase, cbb3-type subunit I [Verrucomicrobiae bacterium]|nr:cytochrome-c oxidase, cbb3-type subunit I [Verrucomicrobiae bacterium]